nr:hypothetical protein [Tanacetum cinerariifolium]
MILESVEQGPLLWPSVEVEGVTRLKKYYEWQLKLFKPIAILKQPISFCKDSLLRMILESVEQGPLLWPSVEVEGVTRLKKYYEWQLKLFKPIAILKQPISFCKDSLLRRGNANFMMPLISLHIRRERHFVNTKFLNTLPSEWSKFVTDVKLARDLHTTNVDQLHAYLGQHKYHANEVRLMNERTSDPLALISQHQLHRTPYQHHQPLYHQSQFQQQATSYQSSPYAKYAPMV